MGMCNNLQVIPMEKSKKICKKCKIGFDDENGYPVCNYCLKLLDDWE